MSRVKAAARLQPFSQQLLLGSIKSNMGHLITAAGAAGLMKILLAMEHKVLPPTIHAEDPTSI